MRKLWSASFWDMLEFLEEVCKCMVLLMDFDGSPAWFCRVELSQYVDGSMLLWNPCPYHVEVTIPGGGNLRMRTSRMRGIYGMSESNWPYLIGFSDPKVGSFCMALDGERWVTSFWETSRCMIFGWISRGHLIIGNPTQTNSRNFRKWIEMLKMRLHHTKML